MTTGHYYREYPPVPALAGLVASVWVQHVAPDAGPYAHRAIPNGSAEIRCLPGAEPRVTGPLIAPATEVLAPGSTVLGVRFRPGAATPVLGLPLADLTGQAVGLTRLWGPGGTALGERIAGSGSALAGLALLQQALAIRARHRDPDPRMAEAVRRLGPGRTRDIGSVSAALGISERQFRRRCQQETGLSPKTLHRMLRFQGFLALTQSALARGDRPAAAGLAALAARSGYADQAHLARECARLTGLSPSGFLYATEQDCGAGHDHAVSYRSQLPPPAPAT
jgi:AraC-like DNA-binding protein